ncbi:MAG: Ig-like domain-containing protein [Clostridia bacterium]|nr:Ig-like domain-containing protein [Clostridia bacterium]
MCNCGLYHSPASSTVELKSLDPQIVSVDESGLITAVNEGTARITVTTGGISDTMTVTVIDNDYTSEPASIGFSGDTRIMSDRFSGGQRGIITANVYDQNGAVMYEDVDFAVTDGIEYTADGNRLMYTVNNDVTSFTIKASCGGIEETANITVVFPEAEYNQYIKSGFDGSLSMLQGKEAQTQTLDAAGITLNVGNRTGGGDNYSGFVMSNGVLRAQAGKYNNADRNAYITLAAPAMSKSGEYMFKTSIMFDAKATDITASIKGGGSSVVDLKVGTSGIEKGVWYDYYIIVNGDTTTQLVKNTQTGEINKKTLDTAVSKIDRIDITGTTDLNQSVSFDDMLLASSAKVLTSAVVSVTDESGNPVEGATVISSLGSGVTRLNGKATIPCFAGGNEFIITRDNLTVTVSAEVNVDYTPVAAVIGTAKGKALDDKTCFISNIENALILKAAYSDNNALTKIERESHIPGKAIIRVGVFSDNNAKTFVWDDNLKPISNAFE